MNRRDALKSGILLPAVFYANKFEVSQASQLNIYPKQLYGICVNINSGNNFIDEINKFEKYAEFKHDIIQYFSSFDYRSNPDMVAPYFTAIPLKIWNSGKIPLLTWYPSTSYVVKNPEDICSQIYKGNFDNYLKRCCKAIVNYIYLAKNNSILGEPKIYIRLGHEMNFKNHVYSNSPKDFIKMWKYVYNYLKNYEDSSKIQLSKKNVAFIFCPGNFLSEAFPFEEYYPGDEYSEWKGLDGYNWGGKNWQKFDEVFLPYLQRMNKLSKNPLSICEFGTTAKVLNSQNKVEYNENLKREWIQYAYNWLSESKNLNKYNIRMSIYYNLSKDNDIDSGIFIPSNVNHLKRSLKFETNDHATIHDLKDVYVKKEKTLNTYNKSGIGFKKIGFVNSGIKINADIFDGNF